MQLRSLKDFSNGESRRGFLKTSAIVAAGSIWSPALRGQSGQSIAIVADPASTAMKQPGVAWALEQLREAIEAEGAVCAIHPTLDAAGDVDELIVAGLRGSQLVRPIFNRAEVSVSSEAESVGLARGEVRGRSALAIAGSDPRGLTYGLLEVADHVSYAAAPAAALRAVSDDAETSANRVRSVTRYFTSDVEDKSWYYDKSFWREYLSMLATQRFNRFSMAYGLGYNRPEDVHDAYLYFTYPFLYSVPGYNVRVPGLPDDERDQNWEMLRWISEETTSRGMDFQVALWTQAYQWINSPKANSVIKGLNPDNHGPYCRDALQKMIQECPAIKGVTIRAHSESGIPEGSYDFWIDLFEGFKRAGRPVEIDIHAKGIEHKLLDMALATGNPVKASPKYWAEHLGLPYHQTSIRELERNPTDRPPDRIETQRRFTRYGYGDYLRADRKYGILYRVWPGTQRTLLWGDPAMAAGYGRYSHFCDSDGIELSDPLSFKGRMGSGQPGGRNAYADASLRPHGGDWRKHAYSYRVWGRLLYNPEASPETWRRQLRSEFGRAAKSSEGALAHASRVLPLITVAHHPSASNNTYWPEIYTNMPIVNEERRHPYRDTLAPKLFGNVSSLDPDMFSSIEEYAEDIVRDEPNARYSPLDVARWLEADAVAAEKHLEQARATIDDSSDPAFRRLAIDVMAQSEIGRFFAEKLRAGTAYGIHTRTGDSAVLRRAVQHYRLARDAWKRVIDVTEGPYLADVSYGLTPHLRGHWKDRLPAIEIDLSDMERLLRAPAVKPGQGKARPMPAGLDLAALFTAAPQPRPQCEHLPPASFQPGKQVALEMAMEAGHELSSARLHYRHVNQAELYNVEEMEVSNGRYRSTIPARYTDSQYPLAYYFELRDEQGQAWIYPGFASNRMNQPYFVIMRT